MASRWETLADLCDTHPGAWNQVSLAKKTAIFLHVTICNFRDFYFFLVGGACYPYFPFFMTYVRIVPLRYHTPTQISLIQAGLTAFPRAFG